MATKLLPFQVVCSVLWNKINQLIFYYRTCHNKYTRNLLENMFLIFLIASTRNIRNILPDVHPPEVFRIYPEIHFYLNKIIKNFIKSSDESQKDISAVQRCSVESQKGAIGVQKSMATAPFWFSMEHRLSALTPFWLSADEIYIFIKYVINKYSSVSKSCWNLI